MINIDPLNRRLANQLLSGGNVGSPSEVVERLGAVQAQDYAGGEWSIGLRLPGSTLADIESAVSRKEIVRTWAMRGTLHFLAAADINWMLELLAPRMIAGLARRYKELGLDDATFRKAGALLARFLKGGKQLTRKELVTMLEKKGISCEGQRAAFILQRASLDRLTCFGVMRKKKETHALFEEWVPPAKPMKRQDALAELARRYFAGYGPATIQDYMWWSGLRAPDANAGLEAVEPELERASIDERTYWMPRREPPAKSTTPILHLLPPFDSYLLGYRHRSACIEPAVARQLRTGGMPDATIVVDGKVAGKWSRKPGNDRVVVTTNTFRRLSLKEEIQLEKAVERYGDFEEKGLDWAR